MAQYQTALRLDPAYANAYVNLGNALFHCCAFRDAVYMYNKALAIDFELADTHYNLAAVYESRGFPFA